MHALIYVIRRVNACFILESSKPEGLYVGDLLYIHREKKLLFRPETHTCFALKMDCSFILGLVVEYQSKLQSQGHG